MLGIRAKINISTVALLLATTICIILISYKKSSQELTTSVLKGNMDLVHATASDIMAINDQEFKMLESLANLSTIKDPSVDMHIKWELVNSATGKQSRYYGLGFFNEYGIGYATTGKWSDLHTREYLRISMAGQKALQDPDFSKVNGHLCTYYAVPVKTDSGVQIAEISAVVDATDLCKTVSELYVGKSSHPFIISRKTGKYVAHSQQDFVINSVNIEENASQGFMPIIKHIMDGDSATETFYDEIQKQKFSVSYAPIGNTDWAVVCMAPYSDFYGGITELLRNLILIGVIAIIIAIFVAIIVVNFSIKPLSEVSKAIGIVATGHADLTSRLDTTSNDEIGKVTKNFNLFAEKLQNIVIELKSSKEDLFAYGEKLSEVVSENAEFRSEILDDIKNINNEIDVQHNVVQGTSNATGKISNAVLQFNEMLEKQISSIEQASAAVTQMIGNIDSVSKSIEKMADEFDSLQDDVNNGVQRQKEVNEKIAQIESQSKMLHEANNVISSIASQTNLLAMNAAIEAAHAGEAGKGFSVVADEIRKLSENSSTQSHNIEAQLKSILSSISNAVNSSELSDKAFQSVNQKLQGTGILVHQIKMAMEEQSEGSKQISEALNYLNDATTQVRTSSSDVSNAREEITSDVSNLTKISESVKHLVNGMVKSVHQIEESDAALLNITTSISESIYRIGSQIDQFKV